jgi:phosphate uptake regulator
MGDGLRYVLSLTVIIMSNYIIIFKQVFIPAYTSIIVKRRVLRVGTSSLAVSLPIKWVKSKRIIAGSEVDLSERDGGIFLQTYARSPNETIMIAAPEGEQFLRRVIISPYIQGYDVISISYTKSPTRKLIEEAVQHTTGFEITEESRGRIVISNVAKGIEDQFEVVFRRMFYIVNTMGDLLVEALSRGDYSLLDDLNSYERTLTKLQNFSKRLLNTQGNMEIKRTTAAYRIVCELEGIGDLLSMLARFARLDKNARGLIAGVSRVNGLLRTMSEVCMAADLQKLSAHVNATRATEGWLMNHAKSKDAMAYGVLMCITQKSREVTVEILYPFTHN